MKRILISLMALTGLVLFSGCGGREEAAAPAPTEAVKTAEPAPAATESAPAATESAPAADASSMDDPSAGAPAVE